jgi:5-methylcytosine-specific restriction endonuclease McrBC GTP-binding regulatory subunit McrB
MVTITPGPEWLNVDPTNRLKELLEAGVKAILLYGPPRTSKTYSIDTLFERNAPDRETIQIHTGWSYDDLMIGLRPNEDRWEYREGPLLKAIRSGKKCIVLEEINRTEFSQAIGEVFSLLEDTYRGSNHTIRLRNGENFYIPADVLILCTMNTLDRSTEDVDDAIFGRMAAVEFPPRVEDLHAMLNANNVPLDVGEKIRELFAAIQLAYPLGHGYFASFRNNTSPIEFYATRIRPVLQKHLQNYRDDDLKSIDEKVNQLFN